MSWLYAYFLAAIVLDHIHLVSPVGLAWSDAEYRREMLAWPRRFIFLPLLCLLIAVAVGVFSHSTRDPAFLVLYAAYVVWNAWHFGSQHFGVASLLGWRGGPRWLRQGLLIAATMAFMLLPFVPGFVHWMTENSLIGARVASMLLSFMPGHPSFIAMLVVGQAISFLHWTTDIGLSVRALRRWWLFLILALVFGALGFAFKTVTTDHHYCGLLPACSVMWSIPLLVSLRFGLGFVHFLYSRWVWRRGAPFVSKLARPRLIAEYAVS